MPYYIATIYAHITSLNTHLVQSEMMLGPFVRRLEVRVPEDFKYLAQQEMERAFTNVTSVELGPIGVSKNQNSLPLRGQR